MISLGIDFGSTGIRAAYAGPGESVRLTRVSGSVAAAATVPWLLCEYSATGISFPSLKHRLGATERLSVDGRPASLSALVTSVMREVCQHVQSETGDVVGRAVISVPARYPSLRREVLREAAREAGLGVVQLINDSVAAVIAQRELGPDGGTFLVYGMGYSGYEIGLVRAIGPHYRVLGYEGANSPCGSALDELIVDAWIDAIGRELLDFPRWDASTWMRVRAASEHVKERLDAEESVNFPLSVTGPAGGDPMGARFDRAIFTDVVRAMAEETLSRARGLLDQSRLVASDVDIVLLVGGSTQLTQVRAVMTAEFGAKVKIASPEHIARGALLFADRDAAGTAADHDGGVGESAEDSRTSGAVLPALTATVATVSDAQDAGLSWLPIGGNGSQTADSADGGATVLTELERARRLVEQDRRDEAVTLLGQIIADAQAMLDQLRDDTAAPREPAGRRPDAAPAPELAKGTVPPVASGRPPDRVTPTARSRRALHEAKALLEERRYEEAVRMSHAVWGESFESPDAFEAMIDIHCQAAMAEMTVERYPDAERWLRCAWGHDQSNTRVRGLLAERMYQHARQLSRLSRHAEALRVIDECLAWDPERRAARELRQRLARTVSAPPPNQ